jgi:hypothetical protein
MTISFAQGARFERLQKQSQIVASLGAQLHRGKTILRPASGNAEGARDSDLR